MYEILLNSNANEGYSNDKFLQKFMEICNEHKRAKRALAFAFVLYDFQNPQISKVLKDEDFWLSLNDLAGEYLTVFSFHFKPTREYKSINANQNFGTQYLTSISTPINPSEASNVLIEKYFGSKVIPQYPSVLFFQIDGNKVIDSSLVQLDEKNIEKSFSELDGYIRSAVAALKQITEDNRNNHKEIFSVLNTSVQGLRGRIVAKRVVKTLGSVTELASSVVDLGK